MDDLDWSKFQQQELEEHLMIMPDSSNTTLLQQYRDNCIPVQQLPKIDNSTPNFFPQWKSRSAFQQQPGPIPDPGPTSPFESIDCLLSASTASIESDGISFIFSTAAKSSSLSDPGGAHLPKRNQTASTKRKRGNNNNNNNNQPNSQNINFRGRAAAAGEEEADVEAVAQMKEMIYQAAAFRPVEFGEEEGAERRPKRKNVRISSDPQTVAARERRERISERIRVLQRLVPGGSKMDTASMLDEAASYLKFLRSQVKALEAMGAAGRQRIISAHVNVVDPTAVGNYANLAFAYSPYLNYPMQQPQQFSIQGPNPIRKPESC